MKLIVASNSWKLSLISLFVKVKECNFFPIEFLLNVITLQVQSLKGSSMSTILIDVILRLGFASIQACMFTLCQNVYHHWCANYHFARFEKYISKTYGQVMHELQWEVSCIRKLGTIMEACKGTMHQRIPNGKTLIAF